MSPEEKARHDDALAAHFEEYSAGPPAVRRGSFRAGWEAGSADVGGRLLELLADGDHRLNVSALPHDWREAIAQLAADLGA